MQTKPRFTIELQGQTPHIQRGAQLDVARLLPKSFAHTTRRLQRRGEVGMRVSQEPARRPRNPARARGDALRAVEGEGRATVALWGRGLVAPVGGETSCRGRWGLPRRDDGFAFALRVFRAPEVAVGTGAVQPLRGDFESG